MNFKGADSATAAQTGGWLSGALKRFAFPALIAGSLCLAFSPIFVRLSEVGPVATAVNRMTLALPAFWLMLMLQRGRRPADAAPPRLRDLGLLILSGLFFAGDLAFWHWSIVLTSVANATVLANMAPVFVVLAAWVLFGERVSRLFIAGLASAIAGVTVLMGESMTISAAQFTGVALGVVTSWFYAAYILTVARLRKRFSTPAIMAVGGTACAAVLWAVAWITEGEVWPDTAYGWMIAFGLAFVTQVFGQAIIAAGLAHVPAGLGAMALLLQPVLAGFIAWLLFGETLSLWQFAGAAAVLVGLELARRGTPRRTGA